MAGIFSWGFGFPRTSLAAAAEATAKGSAGSKAGAGPRPARRPPREEEKKINPRIGELQNQATESSRCLDGVGDWSRRAAGPTWTDAAAGSHAPPGRPVQELWAFRDCCLWQSSSWEIETWTPILTCHCISEVRKPLWKKTRGGGDARVPLQQLRCERAREGTDSRGRREGGHTEPKTSPPRGGCHPAREHRSVTRDAAEARREPPKGLSPPDSQSPLLRSPSDR
jgi:hypothetical protein